MLLAHPKAKLSSLAARKWRSLMNFRFELEGRYSFFLSKGEGSKVDKYSTQWVSMFSSSSEHLQLPLKHFHV